MRPAQYSACGTGLAGLVQAFAWGCVLAGGGCAVDQRSEVAAYRTLIDPAEAVPATEGEPVSLTDAALRANATNERLSIEGENYLQAMIDRQRNASFLMPTFDLFGALTFRDDGGDSSDGAGGSQRNVLFDAGVGGQYTLLTGLSDFRHVQASELTIERRRWLLLDLRESLLLETSRAYYAVLLAERLTGVIESSLEVQAERLRDIQGRRAVGFARPLDVAQIESQVSSTQVSLLDARNQAANARSALSLLTGSDMTATSLSDRFDPPTDAPDLQTHLDRAWSHRQDLAAVAAQAAAARQEVDAQIGRYYPSVTVNLDYFLTRDTVPTDRDWTGLLSVNLPLFTAGRIDADVRAAWSFFRQAVLTYSLTRREIRRDVEVAISDLRATRARVIETTKQVNAAREALRQAEASYEAGLGTNLERVVAQDQLLSAEIGLSREEYSAKVAYLALERASGLLMESLTGVAPAESKSSPEIKEPDSPFVVLPGGTSSSN